MDAAYKAMDGQAYQLRKLDGIVNDLDADRASQLRKMEEEAQGWQMMWNNSKRWEFDKTKVTTFTEFWAATRKFWGKRVADGMNLWAMNHMSTQDGMDWYEKAEGRHCACSKHLQRSKYFDKLDEAEKEKLRTMGMHRLQRQIASQRRVWLKNLSHNQAEKLLIIAHSEFQPGYGTDKKATTPLQKSMWAAEDEDDYDAAVEAIKKHKKEGYEGSARKRRCMCDASRSDPINIE